MYNIFIIYHLYFVDSYNIEYIFMGIGIVFVIMACVTYLSVKKEQG